MVKYQGVFKRYEKKYLISQTQYNQIFQYLKDKTVPDQYGRSTICNIYFDTQDYRLIRASIDKPIYREKLRLRSYGVPGYDDTVFVELKKKYKGVVYKRRVPMPLAQAEDYLYRRGSPAPSCQIIKEIDWFLEQYHPLPKTFIACDRTALFGCDNDSLRFTFDSRIRYRESSLSLAEGDHGRPVLPDGMIVMEIKCAASMPIWLSRALASLDILPVSYSKYGKCYQNFLLPELFREGGIVCA